MVRRWSHYSIRQREALFELDRQLGLGSVPRNWRIFPARLHITQHQPDELGGGLFTGKVAAHPYRLADLSVKALDGTGGVEDFAQFRCACAPCNANSSSPEKADSLKLCGERVALL